MKLRDLPDEWPSFRFQWKVNGADVPSEEVVSKASSGLAQRDQTGNIVQFKHDLSERTEKAAGKGRAPEPVSL